MTYEMKSLRKEDLSLYYYIKDTVLRNFVEREEYVPLAMISEACDIEAGSYVYEYVSDLEPSPTERGRGWRYFDPPSGTLHFCMPYTSVTGTNAAGEFTSGTPEQHYIDNSAISDRLDSGVVVYETTVISGISQPTVVPDLVYMVDYLDGRIISKRELIKPISVSFDWNYISVVDEWAAIEAADPPVIVIDMHGTDKMGYQLGGGKKAVRKVDIHVFASNTAERNDIVETLYDGFYNRSCPVYDLPTGSVLDYDGTFYGRKDADTETGTSDEIKLTYLFDRSTVSHVSSLFFDTVVSRHVNMPLVMTRGRDEIMLSDLNAYRSKVSFDMFSYDDRNIGRIY